MSHYKDRFDQQGMTLIEILMAIAIGTLVIWGATRVLLNAEMRSRIKISQQEAREDIANFGDLIKRIWNIRLRNNDPTVIGVPKEGFFLKKQIMD